MHSFFDISVINDGGRRTAAARADPAQSRVMWHFSEA